MTKIVAALTCAAALLVGTLTTTTAPAAAADGVRETVFVNGDLPFRGSTGDRWLNAPIIDLAVTPSGQGYWLLAGDGGIFTFGDAGFFGSTGAMRLNSPIVSMARTPSGNGYWLAASDGGVFTFGDAGFFGSAGSIPLAQPIVGIAPTRSGRGYHLVAADGGVFTYGDAPFLGSLVGELDEPAVALASHPDGTSYAVVTRAGAMWIVDDDISFTGHCNEHPGAVDIQYRPGAGYRSLCGDGRVGLEQQRIPIDLYPGGRPVAFGFSPSGDGYVIATTGRAIADPVSPFPGGAHSFVGTHGGRPLRWDPCRVTRWWFDPLDAPPGAEAFVREGVDYVSRLLGIPFEYAGHIAREVTPNEGVVVGFAALNGPAGVAGQQASGARFRYGEVLIDTGFAHRYDLAWREGAVGPVLLHELGHLVGLGHVDDASQLMFPVGDGDERGFEDGDLAGLFQLSAWHGCAG